MQTIKFEEVNRKKLFVSFSEPSHKSKKIVIMSHGFRSSSLGPARAFVEFEKLLLENGICSLRFDQPGSGNSEGSFLNSSFNEWVAATSHFISKYLEQDYQVALMGQSMGATTSVVAAGQEQFNNKIACLILWVPDAKSSIKVDPDKYYEEGGEKYRGSFWIEAKKSNFFDALEKFSRGIHLVYGESDRYVTDEIKQKTIEIVANKKQQYMILEGQDHSSWKYDLTQQVLQKEIGFLNEQFDRTLEAGF